MMKLSAVGERSKKKHSSIHSLFLGVLVVVLPLTAITVHSKGVNARVNVLRFQMTAMTNNYNKKFCRTLLKLLPVFI